MHCDSPLAGIHRIPESYCPFFFRPLLPCAKNVLDHGDKRSPINVLTANKSEGYILEVEIPRKRG